MESHISEFTSILLVEEIFTDVFRIPSGCKGLVEQEGTKADANIEQENMANQLLV